MIHTQGIPTDRIEQTVDRLARKLREAAPEDLQAIRRSRQPGRGAEPALWKMMASEHLIDGTPQEEDWEFIVQGIAMMTPTSSRTRRTAHARRLPLGRALYMGRENFRSGPIVPETRLSQILTARGPELKGHLERALITLADNDSPVDWTETAGLILADRSESPAEAEARRRRIARDYHAAGHGR